MGRSKSSEAPSWLHAQLQILPRHPCNIAHHHHYHHLNGDNDDDGDLEPGLTDNALWRYPLK